MVGAACVCSRATPEHKVSRLRSALKIARCFARDDSSVVDLLLDVVTGPLFVAP